MGISGIVGTPPQKGQETAETLLFSRLPKHLFSPLASTNHQQYWALLCRLHRSKFGPDAPLPPSQGYLAQDMVNNIANILAIQDAWDVEDGEISNTSLEVRAQYVFRRITESGWLRIDRYLGERRVSMPPAVSQFLSMLISFAETPPVFVSGKIRSIHMNLKLVADGEAEGESLQEAADQSRRLLEHIRITSTIIRDLMEAIKVEISTAQYVYRFFNEYVEQVFIGDYHELRTKEHPLTLRPKIISIAENMYTSTEQRNKLIGWYETKRCNGDRKLAESLLEKDMQRLFDLQRIDEYLERLDDEIRRANKRALMVLDYRLRSLRPIENLVKHAINSVMSGQTLPADPFGSGLPISPDRLAEPRKQPDRRPPSILRRQQPTDEEVAKMRIRQRARAARQINPLKLALLVAEKLDGRDTIDLADIPINGVSDIRMLQNLYPLAMAVRSDSRILQQQSVQKMRGFRILPSGDTEQPHTYLSGIPFQLTKQGIRKKSKEEMR
jgi:hypothetical protein